MNDLLRIARLRIALQRAFLGRAILRVIIELSLEKEPSEKVKTSLYSASIYQRRHQSNGRQIGRFAAPFSCRSSHWEIFLMQIITTEDLSYANPTHNRPTTYNVLKSSKLTFKTKRFDLRPAFFFANL